MDEKELRDMLKDLAETYMDKMTEKMAKDLADDMCNKIEDIARESRDFEKRKVLLYTTIIERLQKQVDNSCGTLEIK